MPEAQKERKYEIHIPGQAKGTVVGDYATVTNIFEMTHPPAGIPFQAPPLPAHFVPRPEVSDTLKTRLLADEPTDPGVLVISAIHGLGGIGKSTIAAALAYDRDVQERFADGVLWVTLGQQPDLLSLLRGWIQALGGNHFRLTTVEMTTSYLRTLLQGKRSLLVVDDAWQIDHVTPFLAGGSSCHSLITTRERLVVKGVGAAAYAMDTMTSEQAVTLLGARLRRALLEDERVAASELARVVGHHPLALELAAMQLGDDISWNELLADLDREIARLESLESPGTDELVDEKITKRLSLRASFNLSLQRLKPELHHAFAWLGVLREDALITQAMATTLWGLEDERTAREWLRVLYDKALILSATPIRVSGRELSAYRLHDLMHDAARDVLTRSKPNGLEVALAQAHSKLLEHYRFKARDGLWHTLTEDGYIHGHLTWHMEKAGKEDEIHALLREETKEGKNGWYETRRRLGQLVGYLEDVERAWLASKLSGIAEIDVQLLYALVCSSVVARAENIEPPLMRSLSKQILSANQALSYARSMSDPARRFDALLAIVPSLDEELQQKVLLEALLEVERVKEAPCYSQRLKRYLLCTKYPAIRDRALDLALSELQAAPNEHQRSKALAKVLRQMPKIADPRAVIEGFSSSLSRTRVLCAIADSIEPRELKQLIVGILNRLDLDDDYAHASSLVQLGKHIPMDLIDELVQACLSVRRHDARAQACIGLAEWLDGNVRDMLLAEGRACADRIVHLDRRVTTLVSLAKTIAEDPETRDLFSKATDVAIHIEQVDLRAQALYQIAKYSSGEIRDYAFEQISGLVDRIGNSRIKGLMCAVLARHDTVKHLAQFLTDLAEGKIQAGEVALIAPGLADAELSSVLDQLSKIANDDARAKAIRSVIPHLPESLLNDAYLMASSIKRRSERARALTELARLFADTEREVILQEALEYTEIIKNDKARFEAISAFCRDLEGEIEKDILRSLDEISNEYSRALAMGDLAPHLSHDAIDQALEIAQSLVDEYARSLAISSIGPYLSSHVLEKALAIIEGFENEHNHYRAIIRLASRLPRHLDETIYRRILRICDSIHEASVSAKILTGLVRNAPESIQEEALKDLLQVPSDPGHSTRIAALTSLLPDLPAKARPRVLDECTKGISELTSLDQQTKAFCRLTAYLSLEELHKMADDLVSRSYKARGSVHRIRNLSRLVHFLSDEHIEQLMLDVTNDDLRGATSAEKAAILTTIGKRVEGSQGHHLLRKAVTAGLESLSEKPEKPQDLDVQAFADVVKNLPNDLTQEALRAASSLERPEAKALALAALIPHLEFDCRVETAMRAYMSARAVENHRQRSMCLATVVNNVLILQRQQRLCILESIVWLLRREHRAKAYREIAALAPILFSLEIDNISRKMIDNIGMVEEWWP